MDFQTRNEALDFWSTRVSEKDCIFYTNILKKVLTRPRDPAEVERAVLELQAQKMAALEKDFKHRQSIYEEKAREDVKRQAEKVAALERQLKQFQQI